MAVSAHVQFAYGDTAPDAPVDPTADTNLYPVEVGGVPRWAYTDEAGDEQLLPLTGDIDAAVLVEQMRAEAAESDLADDIAAEAALARNGDNITSGTVADARIASTIARDSEVTSAISALSSVYQPLALVLTNTTASFTTADETKVDHLTVTQAVDLDTIEARVNSLDAAVVLRGAWDASAGTFPGGGTAQAGDSYIVSVAGTVDSVAFALNDRIIAITDNASTTTFASNWFKADYTDSVLSVDGRTGAVTLSDLYDAAGTAAALLTATITNGDTTHAPTGDAVFDALALKAPLASPTFTGTVAGITKSMVGLGNVDNTADTAKPVSTAQQTALDLKANLASPTFTGTVAGITKSMVGLGNVDNTSDASKPVSTATQTALDLKAPLTPTVGTGLGTTGSVALDFDTLNGTFQTIALSGNITFTTANLSPGESVTLFISAASLRTFTFPAWIFVGTVAPASIAAGKSGVLTLTSTTTADSGVYAAWAVQP